MKLKKIWIVTLAFFLFPYQSFAKSPNLDLNLTQIIEIKRIGLYLQIGTHYSGALRMYLLLRHYKIEHPDNFIGFFAQSIAPSSSTQSKIHDIVGFGIYSNILLMYLDRITLANEKEYRESYNNYRNSLICYGWGKRYPKNWNNIFFITQTDIKHTLKIIDSLIDNFKFAGLKGEKAMNYYLEIWEAQYPHLSINNETLSYIKKINSILHDDKFHVSHGYWVYRILRYYNIKDPLLFVKLFMQNIANASLSSNYNFFVDYIQNLLSSDPKKRADSIIEHFGRSYPVDFDNLFYSNHREINDVFDRISKEVSSFHFRQYAGDEALNRILPPLLKNID